MSSKKKVVKKRVVTKKNVASTKAKAKAKAPARGKASAKALGKGKASAKAPAKRKASAKALRKGKVKAKAPAKGKARVTALAKGKARVTALAKGKAKAPSKVARPAKPSAGRRRDATGHLDPAYAADLRARSRESAEDLHVDRAFLRKSKGSTESLSEELGQEAVMTMTSAEDQSARLQEGTVEEEIGGPFVITSGSREFALGTDRSNPQKATREPFPKT